MLTDDDVPVGPFKERWFAECLCESMCCACNPIFHSCRKAVSNKKRRFKEDGFDLDLTYLTSRIIVHGFPATGLEHFIRNPRYEVRRFLEQRHGGRYKMYNFCCEPGRRYDPAVFENRVERYPFRDHSVPPLETMIAFGESAKSWLDAEEDHVVSMHCKAGKGRAGLMSTMLMFRCGEFATIEEAIEHYDHTRVTNGRGLTVPSQRRYAGYYQAIWRQVWGETGDMGKIAGGAMSPAKLPSQPQLYISAIEVLHGGDWLEKQQVEFFILRAENLEPVVLWRSGAGRQLRYDFPREMMVERNFCIKVKTKKRCCKKAKRIFEIWSNTAFVKRAKGKRYVEWKRQDIDTKRKIAKKLEDSFILRMYLNDDGAAALEWDDAKEPGPSTELVQGPRG